MWTVELLDDRHDRNGFVCGHPSLDAFLIRYAGQHDRRGIARTYIICTQESVVVGYYSVSTHSVDRAVWPEKPRKKLPHHPVPVTLVGRLAVDERFRGKKLGALLLRDALARSVQVSELMGVHAVLVEAIDNTAVAFYRQFGFAAFDDQPLKLYLPIRDVRAAIGLPEPASG